MTRVVEADIGVVARRRTDIDATLTARQIPRPQSAALDRFPGEFEQQPLLWIDLLGLARGNAEEFRIDRESR
jgi:hypothetical protein